MAHQPRTIHPDDIQDERLAQVPLAAAYTYAYLPIVLDDAGRAKDQPAVLNGYLWPLRADEHGTAAMASDLEALVDAGLLCRYSVGDRTYIHDPAWRTRQRISRPAPSTLPPCPTHDAAPEDLIGDTLRKVSDQLSSFLSSASGSFDESRLRDAVTRTVEDVTFLIDPEKAAVYGQKVREFLGEATGRQPRPADDMPEDDLPEVTVWDDVTDDPDQRH